MLLVDCGFLTLIACHADMVDNVLLMVWRRLCSKTDGTSPGLGHVAGFIQIQHKIFRQVRLLALEENMP
jgi:hypothetical protein